MRLRKRASKHEESSQIAYARIFPVQFTNYRQPDLATAVQRGLRCVARFFRIDTVRGGGGSKYLIQFVTGSPPSRGKHTSRDRTSRDRAQRRGRR